jgi:hypothetical protein
MGRSCRKILRGIGIMKNGKSHFLAHFSPTVVSLHRATWLALLLLGFFLPECGSNMNNARFTENTYEAALQRQMPLSKVAFCLNTAAVKMGCKNTTLQYGFDFVR